MQARIQALEAQVQEREQQISTLDERLAAAEARIADGGAALKSTKARLRECESSLRDREGALQSAEGRCHAFEEANVALKLQVSGLPVLYRALRLFASAWAGSGPPVCSIIAGMLLQAMDTNNGLDQSNVRLREMSSRLRDLERTRTGLQVDAFTGPDLAVAPWQFNAKYSLIQHGDCRQRWRGLTLSLRPSCSIYQAQRRHSRKSLQLTLLHGIKCPPCSRQELDFSWPLRSESVCCSVDPPRTPLSQIEWSPSLVDQLNLLIS